MAGVSAGAFIPGVSAIPDYPFSPAQTLYLAGDSLNTNGLNIVSNTYTNAAPEGMVNWMNAALGSPFQILGRTAAGGTTAADFATRQVSIILGLSPRPNFVLVITGHNDIYDSGFSAATTLASITSGLDRLFNAGIIPIYTTIFARSYVNAATMQIHKQVNRGIREYYKRTKRGLFFDGFKITVDPDSTQFAGRSGWYYDTLPSIHLNNVGSYWTGKYAAAQIQTKLMQSNVLAAGSEDWVSLTDYGNLLTNPMFTGTGGTKSGTDVTGNVPDNWTVSWAARTSTRIAACSASSITDATTGLKVANGLVLTFTNNAADNDEIQIFNTSNIAARMVSEGKYEAQCKITVNSPVDLDRIRLRVLCDSGSSEQAWWGNTDEAGSPPKPVEDLPEGFTFILKTSFITALAQPVTGLFDLRFRWSGTSVGNGTIVISEPTINRIS